MKAALEQRIELGATWTEREMQTLREAEAEVQEYEEKREDEEYYSII